MDPFISLQSKDMIRAKDGFEWFCFRKVSSKRTSSGLLPTFSGVGTKSNCMISSLYTLAMHCCGNCKPCSLMKQ